MDKDKKWEELKKEIESLQAPFGDLYIPVETDSFMNFSKSGLGKEIKRIEIKMWSHEKLSAYSKEKKLKEILNRRQEFGTSVIIVEVAKINEVSFQFYRYQDHSETLPFDSGWILVADKKVIAQTEDITTPFKKSITNWSVRKEELSKFHSLHCAYGR